MTATSDEEALQKLLKTDRLKVTVDDISLLARSLVPSTPKSNRSLAFLCLSNLSQSLTPSSRSQDSLTQSVGTYLQDTFSNFEAEGDAYVPFVYLLSTLFAVAPAPAISLLTTKIIPPDSSSNDEVPDVLDILLESAELPSPLQPALAELLSQAASTKPGREVVVRADAWLRGAVNLKHEGGLGALCAVALSKLTPAETQQAGDENVQSRMVEQVGLAKRMMDYVVATPGPSSNMLSTLEGLSILSTKGHIKHLMTTSPTFLRALLALSPVPGMRPSSLPVTPRASIDIDEKLFEPVETSLCYGLAIILVNLTTRKPVLSAEDEQLAKLRAMAVSGNKGAQIEVDPFEAEEAVEERVNAAVFAGVVPALRGLVRADSVLVKETLGRLCLNLVYDKSHRSLFVRDGGFKVLTSVIRDLLTPPKKPSPQSDQEATPVVDCLPALQALAKIVITTPPHLLFPPPHQTTAVNALTPLFHLLGHSSSSLLQIFEALMALTNLATIDASFCDRIIDATVSPPTNDSMWRGSGREDNVRVITKVEELLLDSHTLVRRAATELVCNLVNSPKGSAHFAGESSARVKSRLNVLLVLLSIDDTPTRLAAGGALAIVSEVSSGAEALLAVKDETSNRTTWTRLMGLLEGDVPEIDEQGEDIPVISSTPPNPDLALRGVVVLYNLVEYAVQNETTRANLLREAREAGIEEKMLRVIKENMARRDILEPAVELLKTLKRYTA